MASNAGKLTVQELRDMVAAGHIDTPLGFRRRDDGYYVNAAKVELAAYEAAVTDWERARGFERL